MANFNTHLVGAAAVSGLAATCCLGAQLASPKTVLLYFSMGTAGGLLPDLDSDKSIVSRILFNTLSVYFSFLLMFTQATHYSVIELLMIFGLGFALANLFVSYGFERLTIHRGMFHSIPAGFAFWFFISFLTYKLAPLSEVQAWLCGFFVFLGYIVHLILDEVYSVDLMNKRIKRSFGTALKMANAKDPAATIFTYIIMFAALYLSPAVSDFYDMVTSAETYQVLRDNLFPTGTWFRGFPGG